MEVVATLEQEAERSDAVVGVQIDRCTVDPDRRDPRSFGQLRIERVADVVRQAELEVRPRGDVAVGVALPLLFEHRLELGAGERGRPEVVHERQHGVRLGERDVAGEQLVAQAARVHHADLGATPLGRRQRVEQGVGDEVAEGRLGAAVVAVAAGVHTGHVLAAGEGGRDVGGSRPDDDAADLVGVVEGGLDDVGDLGDPRVGGDQVGVVGSRARHDPLRVVDDITRGTVDGQHDLADRRAVLAGLHDRPRAGTARDRGVERVATVRVAVQDRVDLLRQALDHVDERPARRDRVVVRDVVAGDDGGALVERRHDHVRLAVGVVAVGQLGCDPVDRLDGVAEVEHRDPVRADERGGLLGHGADHSDVDAVDLEQRVLRQRRIGRTVVVHVRSEVRPLGCRDDPVGEVGETHVELVVADGRHRQVEGVEDVDRRLVLLHRRGEQAGADVVAGRPHDRVALAALGAQLLDRARPLDRVGVDPAVEVVEAEQVDVDQGAGIAAGVEAEDDRIVVRRAVQRLVVEVGDVVVEPAVLERQRLAGVDVPDVDAGDRRVGGRRRERVVERTDLAAEHVGRLAGLGALVDVAGGLEHLDRVLVAVRVEVAGEEHELGADVGGDLVGERDERLGLGDAGRVVGALPVALVGVRSGGAPGALRLEVVDDHQERAVVGAADGTECLGERFAGVAVGRRADQDLRLTDELDRALAVDERRADHVLVLGCHRRRRRVGPHLGTLGGVERRDEVAQRLVARLAERRRVLDLLEPDHVGTQRRDGGDDLGLLAGEVLGVGGASGVAPAVDRDRVALAVGEERAPGELVAGGREVVEDVERGEPDRAPDVVGCGRAGVGERRRLHGGGVVGREVGGRLELPRVVAPVEDDRLGERDRCPGADRVGQRQVRQRDVLVAAEAARQEVDRGPVVEHHAAGGVVGDGVGVGRAARVGDVGGDPKRRLAGGEDDLAVLVGRVHVRHGERTLRGDEHPLEQLAAFGRRGERDDRRLDGRRRLVEHGHVDGHPAARRDLGHAEELDHRPGHLDVVSERDAGGGAEHEQPVRRGVECGVDVAAGVGGLKVEAVEAAGRVGGGDDAAGDHGLADQRAGGSGALDLGDRHELGVARVTGVTGVGAAVLRGDRVGEREVAGVVVAVDAVGAGDRPVVGRRAGRRAGRRLERVRGAVAEQVDDVGVGTDGAGRDRETARRRGQDERAAAGTGVDVGGVEVRCRQLLACVGVAAAGDEVVAVGWDLPGQHGDDRERVGAGVARSSVLERPAAQVDRLVGGVVELDELAVERGAGAATGDVRLVDHDAGAVQRGRCRGRHRHGDRGDEGGDDGSRDGGMPEPAGTLHVCLHGTRATAGQATVL